jgi:hypothetical protein
MSSLTNPRDDFESLAAERKPIETNAGRHLMAQVGDELTGVITKAETIDGKYGELRVITVDPHRAISDGVNTTAAGEVELRCTGMALEAWYDQEQPQPGDLVSLVLAELRDVGKDSPMKRYETAIRRDMPPTDAADPGVQPDTAADASADADIPF